jgi:hypothetical protein
MGGKDNVDLMMDNRKLSIRSDRMKIIKYYP